MPIQNSILVYLVIMIIIFIVKPNSLFIKKDKSTFSNKCILRPFGCGKDKTMFTIHLTSICLAIVLYFFTSLYVSIAE